MTTEGDIMPNEKRKAFKNILTRAGKTFVQAFISYLSIDGFFGVTDLNAIKKIALSILVGALAAGISAVWNAFIEWLTARIDEMEFEQELTDDLRKAEEGDENGSE